MEGFEFFAWVDWGSETGHAEPTKTRSLRASDASPATSALRNRPRHRPRP